MEVVKLLIHCTPGFPRRAKQDLSMPLLPRRLRHTAWRSNILQLLGANPQSPNLSLSQCHNIYKAKLPGNWKIERRKWTTSRQGDWLEIIGSHLNQPALFPLNVSYRVENISKIKLFLFSRWCGGSSTIHCYNFWLFQQTNPPHYSPMALQHKKGKLNIK